MLYHYTTFAAFDGIIRCAELRLNNILNMNDASEMRLFMNGICRAVTEKLDLENEREKSREVTAFFQKELEEEIREKETALTRGISQQELEQFKQTAEKMLQNLS